MTSLIDDEKAVLSEKKLCTWSAMPTPLTDRHEVDRESLERALTHHIKLGCEGVMFAGTCGEGPWLRRSDIEKLVCAGVEHGSDALKIAVQVTDNSPKQILERMDSIVDWGAHYGVVAQPYFLLNALPKQILDFYLEILDQTPVPVIFYDRGSAAATPVPVDILEEIVSHRNVVAVKDSSCDAERFSVMSSVRQRRPELRLMTGNEFDLMPALRAGYDGAFFGGMILTGIAVQRCFDFFRAGEQEYADFLDAETKRTLIEIYGGPKYGCWLAGLKYALVRLGIFSGWSNILNYPLTDECRGAIEDAVERVPWLRA